MKKIAKKIRKIFIITLYISIEDLKANLIPRTILLSSDLELNLALTRFEAFIREFQEDAKAPYDISEVLDLVIQLFNELAVLYDILQRSIPQKDIPLNIEDRTYKFKVPPPIY